MNSKISAFQFYSILLLSRILITLTYTPKYIEGITASDKIFQTLFRFVFGIIITLPVFLLNKKNENELQNKNGTFPKIKALIFSAVFFYFSVTTVSRLDLFAGTVMFPETDVKFLILLVIVLCAYGASLGIEPIARSAVMFVIPVILSLAFIFFSLVKKVDFLNLTPLFYNGVFPVVKTSLNAVGRTVEYAVIAASLPFIKGNSKKGFFIWLTVQTAITAIIFFFEGTVLGEFSNMQLFPVYTIASMAQFSFFRGLGAVITGVWILCAFLKISLLIFLQSKLISEAFGIKRITVTVVSAVLLSAVCLFISGNVSRFNAVDSSLIKFILIMVSVPVLALAELIAKRVKKCVKQ